MSQAFSFALMEQLECQCRVTARLLDHDRRQIGEPSASAVSHPDSPVASPIFDLQASWRGKSLHYIFVGCIFITSSFTFVRKYVDAYNNNSMSNRYFGKAEFAA